MNGRFAVLPPAIYYALVNGSADKIAINKDFGGTGSIASGTVVSVAGLQILKSNHVPSTDESTGNTIHNNGGVRNDVFGDNGAGYGGANFGTTKGIAFQTEAVGTVKLLDLAMDSDYITERLGTLLLAKYAMGHGVLREECCYEFID